MTDMKVIYGHIILAPRYHTFVIIDATDMRDPHLFAEGLGNRRLCSGNRSVGHSTSLFLSWGVCHLYNYWL